MKYWIFIVTNQKVDGQIVEGREILETRLSDKFWGLGQRTANRKWLNAGDKIVFYEGNPTKSFVATATLKSSSFTLSQEQREEFSHGQDIYINEYGVFLEDTQFLENTIPVETIVDNLNYSR